MVGMVGMKVGMKWSLDTDYSARCSGVLIGKTLGSLTPLKPAALTNYSMPHMRRRVNRPLLRGI